MLNDTVIEITSENFDHVLDNSPLPVIFFFWTENSPKSVEFKTVVEKIVLRHPDKIRLATVNCDTQSMIAGQFGVNAIPTTIVIDKGQPVTGFKGTQTEEQLYETLASYLPNEEAEKLSRAIELFDDQLYDQALPLLREAHQENTERLDITLLLIQTLLQLQRTNEAESLLNEFPLSERNSDYQALVEMITQLKQAADSPEIRELQQHVNNSPTDHTLAIQLAEQLHRVGRNEEALELLFNRLQENLNVANGTVKEAFLTIVNALGNSDIVANQYRRQLYALLY